MPVSCCSSQIQNVIHWWSHEQKALGLELEQELVLELVHFPHV